MRKKKRFVEVRCTYVASKVDTYQFFVALLYSKRSISQYVFEKRYDVTLVLMLSLALSLCILASVAHLKICHLFQMLVRHFRADDSIL